MIDMKTKNSAAITGFISCFVMIVYGIASNGGLGTLMRYLHFPSAVITFGGAICAVMITADSFQDFTDGIQCFLHAFARSQYNVDDISAQIISMSETARKEGLLTLEEQTDSLEHEMLKKGLRLVVDGTDPELVRDILETEKIHLEERDEKRIQFWKDLGAYSPAWGMVGTLLGLINMMHDMGDDPDSIGTGMSLALITTLYGSVLANWVCIPIARKLQKSSDQESLIMDLVIEGVLSIQAGENPNLIREKIRTFREGREEQEAA